MDPVFEKSIAEVRDRFDAMERNAQNLVNARETAIRFQYELRAWIEGEMKRNGDPKTILDGVLTKLKAVTPHGRDNKCDQ